LISRWLKRRKFVNFSKSDGRALLDISYSLGTEKSEKTTAAVEHLRKKIFCGFHRK
jgi:hypothetical protein